MLTPKGIYVLVTPSSRQLEKAPGWKLPTLNWLSWTDYRAGRLCLRCRASPAFLTLEQRDPLPFGGQSDRAAKEGTEGISLGLIHPRCEIKERGSFKEEFSFLRKKMLVSWIREIGPLRIQFHFRKVGVVGEVSGQCGRDSNFEIVNPHL